MNKHSIRQPIEQSRLSGVGKSNQAIIAILCLTFFPLVYLIGKTMASLIGS